MNKTYKIIVIIIIFQIINFISCRPCNCPEVQCIKINSLKIKNTKNYEESMNDTIPYSEYAIKLEINSINQICQTNNIFSCTFTNKLNACDCIFYRYKPLFNINIYSTNYFNGNLAGTSLNYLFNTSNLEYKIFEKQDIYWKFIDIPETEQEQKFIIRIELKDGTIFSDTTNSVFLKL